MGNPFLHILLFDAIDAKDPCTRGHCRRVRDLARRIAICAGLAAEETAALELGALLHDVGKIGVPGDLLMKKGRLDARETERLRDHAALGERILQAAEIFGPAVKIVRHHHERFDGTGYPDGLRGADIGLPARIVALSDAFDAMTTWRPYRKPLPLEIALSELKNAKAGQFDPLLVDLFIRNRLYLPPAS